MKKRLSVDQLLIEPGYDDEGFIDYRYEGEVYKLWYGRIGKGEKAPILILHGGPGGNHHNLVAFQALSFEHPVIFYDQLGCGNSDRPQNPNLWKAQRYFDEVRVVRDGLNLTSYHLIGHSWGTTLAVGFAANNPEGIISLSLHSPILSFPYYLNNVAPLLKQSLGQAGQVIDDFELDNKGGARAYEQACLEFTKRHVIHTWPLPAAMEKLISRRNPEVHDVMVGSDSELNVLGNLKTVSVIDQLSDLDLAALITCGEEDLCTPAFTEWQAGFARDYRFYIISSSAHMTSVDRPRELIKRQRVFLAETEK